MARKKGQLSRIFVGILLLMLIVGLAGFGVTNFGGRTGAVGQVGDVEIDMDQYARALNADLRVLRQNIGQNISLEQARAFGLNSQVMAGLIAGAALTNETIRIGLSVGDQEVQRQLLATQGFRGLDGLFDRDSYEFALDRNNLTARQYESDLRDQTAGTILQSAIITGVFAPLTYGDVVVAYLGERRSFAWLEIDAQSLTTPVPAPTDADLRAYFDANPDRYMLPETKRLTYVWLIPDFVTDKVEVSDDDLRAIYDSRSDEYNIPERRLVERLVFATMTEAEAAAANIAAGDTSFADVVAGRGLTLADVDMGDVTRDALDVAADVVFSLTEPGVTAAVETDLGPGIFRVNAFLSARTTAFDDVRAVLLEEAAADAARRFVDDQIAEYDDLLAGGVTLEELADETDMRLGQIDWVASSDSDVAAYARFTSAARLVTSDDFPTIEALSDGGIFALRLDAVVAERLDSFENSKVQIADDWSAAETSKALLSEAEALISDLEAGAALSSLGVPVAVETLVKRDSVYLDKPSDFLARVFDMETGETTSLAGAAKVLIIQLNGISQADPQDPGRDALHRAILDDVAQTIGQDALSAFSRALQQQAGISLNQTAINAVHAQFSGPGVAFVPQQIQGGAGDSNN